MIPLGALDDPSLANSYSIINVFPFTCDWRERCNFPREETMPEILDLPELTLQALCIRLEFLPSDPATEQNPISYLTLSHVLK